jgi:hypothetical protein
MSSAAVRQARPGTSSQHLDIFAALSKEYSDFGAEAGVPVKPYHDQTLPLFGALNETQQKEAIRSLEASVEICRDTKAQGNAIGDSAALLWSAIKKLGLRPPSDLFSYLPDCTLVEIYSPLNVQIFRSFSFFGLCSYTLEELYCQDWVRLFPRDDHKFAEAILEHAADIFSGKVKNTISLRHIPKHILREAYSEGRHVAEIGVNWAAPLFQEGQSTPGAIIFLEDAVVISKGA